MRTPLVPLVLCTGLATSGCGLLLDVDPPGENGGAADAGRWDGRAPVDAARERDASGYDGWTTGRDASSADASPTSDAGPISCSVDFEYVEIVCTKRSDGTGNDVRADFVAHFDGCGCVRAVIRAENAGGTAWNISDEDVTDGVVSFDAGNPFILGGASTDMPYSIEVCCETAMPVPICVTRRDVVPNPCP